MSHRIAHLLVLGVSLSMIVGVSHAFAQVRESASYKIQSDSINIGGELSTSTNYRLEDTTGEVGAGESASASYALRAGYQQMQEIYLSLAGGDDVVMSPALGGLTGGESNGSTTMTATTDNPAGYQLRIRASSTPAMQKGTDSILDYEPVASDPDFVFITDPTDSQFGFSPEGTDVVDRYRDNGSVCNSGSGETTLRCWDGLFTSDETIASRSSANHPNGTDTAIRFRVGIGSSVVQPVGTYVATTTVTLLPL